MEKIKILLAEDELALATIIKESLETRHFEVTIAVNGEVAFDFYFSNKFDVLLFDVMMPKIDGYTLTKEIRQIDKHIPIILLTSKSQTSDVIHGFKSGANDYLKKPFSMEELIVRIDSLLGRHGQSTENIKFEIGTYVFDFSMQTLINQNETHTLTFMEASLLLLLVENKNHIVDRSIILQKIWGHDNFFNGRSMDVFITKLRKKLGADSKVQIINSRGHGYKIVY